MNSLRTSEKLMISGMILSVLSLFFKWSELLYISANGFKQQGYILLLIFIYPFIKILRKEFVYKIIGYICGGVGLFFSTLFIYVSSIDFLGSTIHTARIGPYIFIISCVLFLIGVRIQEEPKIKNENEKES